MYEIAKTTIEVIRMREIAIWRRLPWSASKRSKINIPPMMTAKKGAKVRVSILVAIFRRIFDW